MSAISVSALSARPSTRGKWLFLGAFAFSCLLFWWLPSLLFRVVLGINDPVEDGVIVLSMLALTLFVAGYLLHAPRIAGSRVPAPLLDACEEFAYQATIYGSIPALLFAAAFWYSRSNVDYGTGEGIPGIYQAVLYSHIFLGLLFLGIVRPDRHKRRLITAILLMTLPRLIVSLRWGRFFLAQAVVPILFIAVARGWIRFSFRRMAQVAALAVAILFIPALTRGDSLASGQDLVDFFAGGSTLRLFQDNRDLNLSGRCPPLLVSFTAKIVPYPSMGVCVLDLWGIKNMPATLDRILAYNEPGSEVLLVGPGSNYLLELYLAGGYLGVLAGSALFGLCCRRCVASIGRRSLFTGIWAECLTRALLAPRSNLGYVFERVPTLILATMLVLFVVWAGRLMQNELAPGNAGAIEG